MELIDRARRYIEKMEPAISGSGGHSRTFAVAGVLVHGFAFDKETALSLLREWNGTHCNPEWNERELLHKIDSALACPGDKPAGYLLGDTPAPAPKPARQSPAIVQPAPAWPDRDHSKILGLLRESFVSLTDLETASPVALDHVSDPYAIIDNLFLGGEEKNPWLCLARDIRQPATKRRATWQGHLERAQFIVPNPMSGPKGKTQEGRDSVRCLANTGPRKFLVVECDFTRANDRPLFDHIEAEGVSVPDLCSTVLARLAQFAPLVMAVHSGGKSLHGWFAAAGQPEAKLKDFMRWACLYGADRATWPRCQLVRLPNGKRDNGNLQSVHYLDFSPVQPGN